MNCEACLNIISKNDHALTCAICKIAFHNNCLNISDSNFKKMATKNKQSWKCPKCKSRPSSPAPPSSTFSSDAEDLYDRLTKHFDNKISEIKKMFEEEISDLKKSSEFISNKYDDLLTRFKEIQEALKDTKFLREENDKQNTKISSLESRLADLEQDKLSDCVEMAGVELRPGEQATEAVLRVASALGLPLLQQDIRMVTRTQDRRRNTPDKLQITFYSQTTRESMLSLKNAAKTLNSNSPIFLSEVLSPYYKELMWKTKQTAKETLHQFVWFKSNKLLVRKASGEKIFQIKHENDLKKMGKQA